MRQRGVHAGSVDLLDTAGVGRISTRNTEQADVGSRGSGESRPPVEKLDRGGRRSPYLQPIQQRIKPVFEGLAAVVAQQHREHAAHYRVAIER